MARWQEALERARICSDRAAAATDTGTRDFNLKLRNSWINIANSYELIEYIEDDVADKRPPLQ